MELQNLTHFPDNDTALPEHIPEFDEFEISVHDDGKKNDTENDTVIQIKNEPDISLEENQNFYAEPFSIIETTPIVNPFEKKMLYVEEKELSSLEASDFDNELSFKRISNYEELESITYKINNQAGFLENLVSKFFYSFLL